MSTVTQDSLQETSALTKSAFARLLAWLDDGTPSGGHRYHDMRRRLVGYFDRRNRPCADDLADETFNRIAHTLAADERILITPPARYCYVVARFVLLEDVRRDWPPKEAHAPRNHWPPGMPGRSGSVHSR